MGNQGFVAPLAFWASAVNPAGIETAVRAYKRGDYSAALVSFHTLAKQGNIRATYYLGEMYRSGHGVPKEITTALKWYVSAAAKGHRASQTRLGMLYAQGEAEGDPDHTKAYAWLSVAADNGDTFAAEQRDIAALKLSVKDLEKAKALYKQILPHRAAKP